MSSQVCLSEHVCSSVCVLYLYLYSSTLCVFCTVSEGDVEYEWKE